MKIAPVFDVLVEKIFQSVDTEWRLGALYERPLYDCEATTLLWHGAISKARDVQSSILFNKNEDRRIMKRINYIKPAFFTLCAFLMGMTGVATAEAQPEEKTLLWKIEGKGIQPSYLMGTIHILPQSEFELKEKVQTAFDASELLVLELDIDDPGLQASIMQHAGMDNGETLDQLLPPLAYEKIDRQLKEVLGVGIQPFNTFKPLLIASFLTAKYVGEQPASFEATLMQMAMEKGIEVQGLETVADQMAVFDKISYPDQVKDLVEMIDDEDRVKGLYKKLLGLYKAEDQKALFDMMGEYFDDPAQLEVMINERNKNWIPLIEAKAKTVSTFFGVGAGHLGGEQGVLSLLKKAGYKVTPVM
ncbi:MAG: TraB/GumN family protein [Rhodothermales bacterium]